jgi:organic radical activating enzyme
MLWKVVPMSPGQLLDVRTEDLVCGGHFRLCDTYRGGGGYDQLPKICSALLGESGHNRQFVVQLYGCTLDCPYCYVTREGVWGDYIEYSTQELIDIFLSTEASVFHLMGGAPGMYLRKWPEIIAGLSKCVRSRWLFNSDLLLNESTYSESAIEAIKHPRAVYAVDIKGLTPLEYKYNTRKSFNEELMWKNIITLEKIRPQYYFSFTNVHKSNIDSFWAAFKRLFGEERYEHHRTYAFTIDLINYNAMPFVDTVAWGRR